MTAQQLARKNGKASLLNVFKVAEGQYFVESSKNNICYKVTAGNNAKGCTCPDFQKNVGKSASYVCKHILAVIDCNGDAINIDPMEHEKSKLDSRFITNVSGKDFVLYSGLLDLAHQKGIKKIQVEPEQFPTKENGNVAICKAIVESVNGEVFTEWGDANPQNVNKMIAKHLLRMAATRAKARALRDFSNIGMTCLDELAELDDVVKNQKKPRAKVSSIQKPVASKPAEKKQASIAQIPEKKTEAIAQPTKTKVSKQPEKETEKEKPVTQKPPVKGNNQPSTAQLRAIENLARRRGISSEELETMSQNQFGTIYTHIAPSDAAAFIRNLQQSA